MTSSPTLVTALRDALSELVPQSAMGGEGMADTPARMAAALLELTDGYTLNERIVLARTFPADGYDQVVALANIPFYSLCEHHVLPFHGTAGVAYLPGDRVVGLSKLARLVDMFARRLQIQERLTVNVADALEAVLAPRGVAVVVKAQHLCMTARGIQKPGAAMITSIMRGSFRDNADARAEVMRLLDGDR